MLGVAVFSVTLVGPPTAHGQDMPPQRQIRAYIPPDQLVSFLPSTPFDRFLEFVDPIFQRVTGKQVVDPEGRTTPIGVSIAGMHFLDAFELVLQYNGLYYRETDRFFLVEVAPVDGDMASGAVSSRDGMAALQLPATKDSREIQINAVLFEVNENKVRNYGLNWDVFVGQQGGSGGQSGGSSSGSGGSSSSGAGGRDFFLLTEDVFDGVSDYIEAPDKINFRDLKAWLNFMENEGLGETIASPQVTVQSAEKGRIQIGSDVPVQVRDFAGNTVTQFFSTGIIIDVTPTLIRQPLVDTLGAEMFEFIHLDVQVEKSSSRPSLAGLIIDRNTAETKVLLLDGEQTVIGGLYSTEETVSRTGMPFLKDLPGWFFGLRYVFGRTQKSVTQKELMIVLQARVLDNLEARSNRPFPQDLLKVSRGQIEQTLRRFNGGVASDFDDRKHYDSDGE